MKSNFNEKLAKALANPPEERHSYFQLQHFVIENEPTIQGRLWKCLRELASRKESMDALHLQIEDIKDDLTLWQLENSQDDQVDDLQKNIIRKRKALRHRDSLVNTLNKLESYLKHTRQEAEFILEYFEKLNAIEPVKDFDDIDAQKDYWSAQITQKLNLKSLLQQPLDIQVVQMALNMDEESTVRRCVENMLERVRTKMTPLEIEENK